MSRVGSKSRTLTGSRRAISRKPSCLISWIQSRPHGGRADGDGRQGTIKPEDGRRVRDNMGKTKYHVACTLQRENGTPCKSLITLGTDLYRCDTGQLVRRGRNLTVRGFLSDGS